MRIGWSLAQFACMHAYAHASICVRKEGKGWYLEGMHLNMHAYIHMRQNNEVSVGEKVRKVERRL